MDGKSIFTVCESRVTSFLSYLAGFVMLAAGTAIAVTAAMGYLQTVTLAGAVPSFLFGLYLIQSGRTRKLRGGKFTIDGDAKTVTQKTHDAERKWSFKDVRMIKMSLDISDGTRPPHFVFWLRLTLADNTKLNIAKGTRKELLMLRDQLKKLDL